MAQWKMKSASDEFAQAISLKPNDKQIYLLKARADYFRNEREEALAASRKAIEIDPSFAEAHAMIGEILMNDKNRQEEAIAAYRTALKYKPDLSLAYERLGNLLIAAKDEKGAEEIFRMRMAKEKNNMEIRFALGRLLVKQGRLKEARTIWEDRTSDQDRTFPNFITVLERAEKLKQATDALAQNPKDPEFLVQMGFAVMEGDSWVVDGRQERAIDYFKKALEIKPKFVKAQYGICKAYVQLADTFKDKKKNADEEITKLRSLDPKLASEMEEYRKNYSGG
jgi:cytochrome c-type biogenesis protein CcmH/NrfG